MIESREIVVVGGGPAGATAALLLQRAGHDVLLIDEARFPRDKICGEALSPGAWRVLESLGATADIARVGTHALAGMTLVAPNGASFSGRYDGGHSFAHSIERHLLDELLLGRARREGVEVREGVRLVALRREAGAVAGVDCEQAGRRQSIAARLVIGADGRRSRVARSLGLLREATRPRRFAVRGHWDGVSGLTEFGEMHVAEGGYCGLAPLGPDSANITFVLERPAMMPAGGDLPSFYLGTLPRWPRIWERLLGARLRSAPRAIGPLALTSRGVWSPGALLVGDAAGFLDPFTGEGIALALRGAMLAADVAHEALHGSISLSEYGRRHRQLAREKFQFNRAVQWLVARPKAANLAAAVLARCPRLADRLVGIAGDCLRGGSDSAPLRPYAVKSAACSGRRS
jgi:geranylgeranyl reductase family protein